MKIELEGILSTKFIQTSADSQGLSKKIGKIPEDDIDIAEVGLMLASLDRPGVSLQKYHHHLEILFLRITQNSTNCYFQ